MSGKLFSVNPLSITLRVTGFEPTQKETSKLSNSVESYSKIYNYLYTPLSQKRARRGEETSPIRKSVYIFSKSTIIRNHRAMNGAVTRRP